MKNVKMNSCLADFENELENLNHSEMKELVGGLEETYTFGQRNPGSFGGFNSFEAFASNYGLNNPSVPSNGNPANTPAPTGVDKCLNEYDKAVKEIKDKQTLIDKILNPEGTFLSYHILMGLAGSKLAECIKSSK